MVEGFYTQHSWLDVDDNVLVAVDNGNVMFFSVAEETLPDVQNAFQKGSSFEALSETAKIKKGDIVSITMSTIDKMSSSHKKDTIIIERDDDYHSIEFLNVKTKEHALEQLKLLLSGDLTYRKVRLNRLRATTPWLFTLIAIGLIMFFIQNAFVWAIVFGIGFFFVLPKMLRELLEPTQMEIWEKASE